MGRLGFVLLSGVLLAMLSPAGADVIWDQSNPAINYGGDGAYIGTAYMEEYSNKCDDFMFATDYAVGITKVTFWVANYSGNVGLNAPPIRASIEFFSNDNGLPAAGGTTNGSDYNVRPVGYDPSDPTASIPSGGWYTFNIDDPDTHQGGTGNNGWLYRAIVEVNGKGLEVTDTGRTDYRGYTIWEVTATLPVPFYADPNVHYWIGMNCSDQVTASTPADGFEVICLSVGNVTLDNAYESGIGVFWGGGYDFQYVMEGIPEPATMSLLCLGGLGLLVRRNR